MALVIQVERMRDIVDEIRPLHVEHWREREDLRPSGDYNPDYERFFAAQEAGVSILVTARRDRRLVGYCTAHIHQCMWTRERYASPDLTFVIQAERGSATALRMVRYAHLVLKAVGIKECKTLMRDDNRVRALLRRVGYRAGASAHEMGLQL